MKKLSKYPKKLLLYATILIGFAVINLNAQTVQTSKDGSKTVIVRQTLIDNCAKVLDENEAQDKLIQSQDEQIKLLNERLETEKEKSAILAELADSRKKQAELLAEANNSLKTVIAAQELIILNKDKEIILLKKQSKPNLITKAKYIGIGIFIGTILSKF